MPFTNAAKNLMLDALAATIDEISVHNSDPGTTGTDEVTGGSYARIAPSLAAAASGEAEFDTDLVFDIPSGSTPTHFGMWDGATFVGKMAISGGPLSFPSDGTLTLLNTTSKLVISD